MDHSDNSDRNSVSIEIDQFNFLGNIDDAEPAASQDMPHAALNFSNWSDYYLEEIVPTPTQMNRKLCRIKLLSPNPGIYVLTHPP